MAASIERTPDSFSYHEGPFHMRANITEPQMRKIYDYIRKNPPTHESRYLRRCDTELARSLFINEEGRIFLLLNRGSEADSVVGTGNYKKVVLAMDLMTGETIVSISARNNVSKATWRFQRAVNNFHQLRDVPGISRLIGNVTYTSSKRGREKMRLFTPYCNRGDLIESILKTSLSLDEKKQIFESIIRTCAALHEKGFVHRDIKPDNIFLHKDSPDRISAILGDLDFITHHEDQEMLLKPRGTKDYLSPEYLRSLSNDEKKAFTYSDDIWALGLTLYGLLTNRLHLPTSTGIGYEDYARTLLDQHPVYSYLFDEQIKSPLDIVYLMLKEDPEERITAQEALSHLEELNWEQDFSWEHLGY